MNGNGPRTADDLVAPALIALVDAGECDPRCVFAEDDTPCDCRCRGEYHAAVRAGRAAGWDAARHHAPYGRHARYIRPGETFHDVCPNCYEVWVCQGDDLVQDRGRIWRAPFWCEHCNESWVCWFVLPAWVDLAEDIA